MDGKNSAERKNEGEENKDQNAGGYCSFTSERGKRVDGKNLPDEMDDVTSRMESSQFDDSKETDVDAWIFKKAKDTRDGVPSTTKKTTAKMSTEFDSESYNMEHKRRGIALLFNNVHFGSMEVRKGSDKDCNDLAAILMKMDFEVKIYKDPTSTTIGSVLSETAALDHSDADCLIVAVMTHGESSLLYSAEGLYPVDMLWAPFTADKCPTLAGKPKLFFIQACRGDQLDDGVDIMEDRDETDSAPSTYTIPIFADIMVAYSTVDGFYSWRNPDDGSWFIQSICKEFEINGQTRDLLTMMTFVNRRVAFHYKSYVPHKLTYHQKKQVPSFTSMLTRLVYFTKKEDSRGKMEYPQVQSAEKGKTKK